MRILTYKEFIEACRVVVESCTGHNTEGWTYDEGRKLVIEFGIEGLSIKIGLYYDEHTHYWKAYLNLFVDINYYGDENSYKALEIIDCMKGTILELYDILSDCLIDYRPAYGAGDFVEHKWKLPAYGEK
jgi:hypothetical protein